MEIQPLLLDQVFDFIDNQTRKAVVTINGEDKEYTDLRTSKDGRRLKKMLYIEGGADRIQNARLVDPQGRNLHVKSMDIVKGEDGFMVVFIIDVLIEGA